MRDQILHLVEEKLVGNFHTDIRLSSFCGDVVAVKKNYAFVLHIRHF